MSERPKVEPEDLLRMKGSITVIFSDRGKELSHEVLEYSHNASHLKLEVPVDHTRPRIIFSPMGIRATHLIIGITDSFKDRQMILFRPMMKDREKEDHPPCDVPEPSGICIQ